MSSTFDPYHIWLGIPPEEQPADHYRLLGIKRFETNENVIANAADQRMSHVRTFQTGKNSAASQAILNQLAAARICLLNAAKKSAYDESLRARAPAAPLNTSESGIQSPARPLPVPVEQLVTRPPGPVNTPPRAVPVVPDPPTDARIWVDTHRPSARRPFWRSPAVLAGGLLVALGVVTAMSLGLFDDKTVDPLAAVEADTADDAVAATDPSASTHSETVSGDRPVESPKDNDVAEASETDEPAESAPATPPHPPAGTDSTASTPPSPALPRSDANAGAAESDRAEIANSSRVETPMVDDSGDAPAEDTARVEDTAPAEGAAPAEETASESDTLEETIRAALAALGPRSRQGRLALPNADEQRESAKLVDDVFRDEFANAKSTRDKAALATLLIAKVDELDVDPASQFAMLRRARDLAVEAVDAEIAIQCVSRVAKTFEVDELVAHLATLKALAAKLRPADRKVFSTAASDLSQRALGELRVGLADEFANLAVIQSVRTNDTELRKLAQETKDAVKSFRSQWSELPPAVERLERDPQPADLTLVGTYLCLVRGDWQRGLPLLAAGEEGTRREVALRDLANPGGADQRVELADAWYDLAARDPNWTHFQGRAHHWYQQSVAGVEGLTRVRVQKRIQETAGVAAAPHVELESRVSDTGATESGPRSTFIGDGIRLSLAAELSELVGSIHTMEFAPNGKTVAVATGASLDLWDVVGKQRMARILPAATRTTCLAFSADGKVVVSGGEGGRLETWDAQQGTPVSFGTPRLPPRTFNRLQAIAFVDPLTLVCRDSIGRSIFHNIATGQSRYANADVNFHSATSVAFGGFFMAAATGPTIRVWQSKTCQTVANLDGHTETVSATAFSKDGQSLVSGGYDGAVILWELKTGQPKHKWEVGSYLTAVAFSDDGQLIAAGDTQGVLRLWNAKSGRIMLALKAHRQNDLEVLTFSSDSKQLASGGREGVLRLWSITRSGVYSGTGELQQGIADEVASPTPVPVRPPASAVLPSPRTDLTPSPPAPSATPPVTNASPAPDRGLMDVFAATEIVEAAGILHETTTQDGRKQATQLRFSQPEDVRIDDGVFRALTKVRHVIIDPAAGDAAFAKAALLPNLESLRVSANSTSPAVSPAALGELARMQTLQSLDLSQARLIHGALAQVAHAKGLHVLRLPEGIQDADLAPLRELRPRIVRLSASLTDDCLALVGQWPVVNLDTGNARITDQGIVRLAESPAGAMLSELLIANPAVSSRGLASIARLRQLRTLHLSADVVLECGLGPLQQAKLTMLVLNGGGKLIDAQLESLPTLPVLTSLTLNGGSVSDAGLKHVANCTGLKHLVIRNCPEVSDQGLAELKALSQLTTLDIPGSSVTQQGRQALQQALPNLRIL